MVEDEPDNGTVDGRHPEIEVAIPANLGHNLMSPTRGADEPYDKLKRAPQAEVDEAAWSALYSTTSQPFDKPETGKIAVKVINHYGDEVVKVYEVK